MSKRDSEQLAKLKEKFENGSILDQPCWSFIKEMNSSSDERLDSVAVRDGYRAYTYRQMFRNWERYAEAFTGAGLTRENGSRVALIGTPTAEVIFAFYGLNMAGAAVSHIYPLDLFTEKQIRSMIEREKITDLMVSEIWAFPLLMKRLLRDREKLGLRNIIVLESPMGGEFGVPALEAMRTLNADLFREMDGGLLMADLLKEHEATPIAYPEKKSCDSSVILHTTGTVNGMHKPVPMSDKAINAFVPKAIEARETYDDFKDVPEHPVTCLTLNMSWVYSFVDMLHMPLGLGMEVICLPWGGTNPRYGEAIEHYGFNVLFTSMSILDFWLKSMPEMDLSAVKVVFMGGTYIPPDYKQRFNDYLKSCGSSARVVNGYGLSEMGGACIIAPSGRDDDAIGFPLPGFKAKIFDEDEERYYDLSDGPHVGVLFLSSDTMSTGRLDDEVFFELTNIDGEDYLNTNDLVRVNDDGSLTCIGRSNQYFINNSGVRFDAGLVQVAVTSQPGIVACGLAPEFHKMIHDNVPVLYVETTETGPAELPVIHRALVEVFVKGDMLADSNMPSQCVIVDKMPLNTGGKVDAKRLASGGVDGKRFSVQPVKVNETIVDVVLVPVSNDEKAIQGAGVPEELENDPYNIIGELLVALPEITDGKYTKLFKIPGLRELVIDLTGFDIKNIPRSMMKSAPKMFDMSFRKYVAPFMGGTGKMGAQGKGGGDAGSLPVPPMWGPIGWGWDGRDGEEESASKARDLRAETKLAWEKSIDIQKSTIEMSRNQYDQFFEGMQDAMDDFAERLPEKAPWAPPLFPSPRSFRKSMRSWEKMNHKRFKERADLWADFAIKSQEKACKNMPTASKTADGAEDGAEEAETPEAEA